MPLPPPSRLARHWALDPDVVFLNHGSFGACPRVVLEAQHKLRQTMEAEPVRFLVRELPDLLDHARRTLATFVDGDGDGLAFVANATTGVNTALAALPMAAGDQILVTDHGYPACRNAVEVAAKRAGAEVIEAHLPFPVATTDTLVDAVLCSVSRRTRAAVVDHVTSSTGLVLPIATLVTELERRGVAVIIDGAHGPGMTELGVTSLGAAFYAGNCHKWLCAPKGAGFLWVRDDWRDRTRPLVTSHGWAAPSHGRNRLHLEFDWTGTNDPTPWLAVPEAISAIAAMVDGGWSEVRARNHRLAIEGRRVLCRAFGIESPCPDEMIGSLAAVPLPETGSSAELPASGIEPLQNRLFHEHRIEVPVTRWAHPVCRAIRISAQLYNSLDQIRYLASVLT